MIDVALAWRCRKNAHNEARHLSFDHLEPADAILTQSYAIRHPMQHHLHLSMCTIVATYSCLTSIPHSTASLYLCLRLFSSCHATLTLHTLFKLHCP